MVYAKKYTYRRGAPVVYAKKRTSEVQRRAEKIELSDERQSGSAGRTQKIKAGLAGLIHENR